MRVTFTPLRGAAATLAIAFGLFALAGPAQAAPMPDPTSEPGVVSVVTNGSGFDTTMLEVPILGAQRVVPGDSRTESITVRNDGEVAGTLRATIVGVTLAGDSSDPFYSDFLVNGASVSSLFGTETELLTTELAEGESASIDLSYDFPLEAVSGNDLERVLEGHFDLELTMTADTDAAPAAPGLPSTGVDGQLLSTVTVAAFALVAAGLVLFTRRRVASRNE